MNARMQVRWEWEQVSDTIDTLIVLNKFFSAGCLREAWEAYQAKVTRKTVQDLKNWMKWAKQEMGATV